MIESFNMESMFLKRTLINSWKCGGFFILCHTMRSYWLLFISQNFNLLYLWETGVWQDLGIVLHILHIICVFYDIGTLCLFSQRWKIENGINVVILYLSIIHYFVHNFFIAMVRVQVDKITLNANIVIWSEQKKYLGIIFYF